MDSDKDKKELDKFEKLTVKQIWDFCVKYKWVAVVFVTITAYLLKKLDERILYIYNAEELMAANSKALQRSIDSSNSAFRHKFEIIELELQQNRDMIEKIGQENEYFKYKLR